MLSIVIPAYNEADNITHTLSELCATIAETRFADNFEITVVDDHSSDGTFEAVKAMANPALHAVRLSRRSGSHTALRAGLAQSHGEAVLCVSADGQDNPEVLREMLSKWENGVDIVWALRRNTGKLPFHLRIARQVFYYLLETLSERKNREIDLTRADFYLLDRKVVDAVNECAERNTSLFGLVEWLGFCQDFVEYDRRERRFSKPKWATRDRFRLAKDWIIAFSGLPLKLVTVVGFGIAGLGFLYAFIVLLRQLLFGTVVQGWSSLMVTVVVIGGLQIMILGVIGEYLWRTLDESRQRKLYWIEKSTRP